MSFHSPPAIHPLSGANMILRKLSLFVVAMCFAGAVFAQSVDFVEPKNGATVGTTFKVKFAVEGMSVAPAGEVTPGTGHHHLLIDTADIEENVAIPMDDKHRHFGKGQTETEITLAPGKHKLTMQFADGAHRSYGAKFRKTIEIEVK
jgi:Domain of unknown function (DUF4399)